MIRDTKQTHLSLRLTNKETIKLTNATYQKGVSKSQLMRIALNNYFTENNIVAETATNPNQLAIV